MVTDSPNSRADFLAVMRCEPFHTAEKFFAFLQHSLEKDLDDIDSIKTKAFMLSLPMGFIGHWHKQKWLQNNGEKGKNHITLGINDLNALCPNSFSSPVASKMISELKIHYTFIGAAKSLQISPERKDTLIDEIKNGCALQLTPILCLHATNKENWPTVLQEIRNSCNDELLEKVVLNLQGAVPYNLQELLSSVRQNLTEVWPEAVAVQVKVIAEITEDMCSNKLIWHCKEADGLCLLLSRLSSSAIKAFIKQMPAAPPTPWTCTIKADQHHMSAVIVEATGEGESVRETRTQRWELLTPYTKAIAPLQAAIAPSAKPLAGRAKLVAADTDATGNIFSQIFPYTDIK